MITMANLFVRGPTKQLILRNFFYYSCKNCKIEGAIHSSVKNARERYLLKKRLNRSKSYTISHKNDRYIGRLNYKSCYFFVRMLKKYDARIASKQLCNQRFIVFNLFTIIINSKPFVTFCI